MIFWCFVASVKKFLKESGVEIRMESCEKVLKNP